MRKMVNRNTRSLTSQVIARSRRAVIPFRLRLLRRFTPRNDRLLMTLLLCVFLLAGCATTKQNTYVDPNMDFGAIQTVAVMPFVNLARDTVVPDRVRDVFINKLLATGAIYVLPPGEVARGVARAEIATPTTPSSEEVIKLGGILKVQAVFTGVVKEYGEVRAGTTSANMISVSLQLFETQTGKVVWTASSTKGGITIWDRLFGGGGKAMNEVTEEAVDDLLKQLFR